MPILATTVSLLTVVSYVTLTVRFQRARYCECNSIKEVICRRGGSANGFSIVTQLTSRRFELSMDIREIPLYQGYGHVVVTLKVNLIVRH